MQTDKTQTVLNHLTVAALALFWRGTEGLKLLVDYMGLEFGYLSAQRSKFLKQLPFVFPSVIHDALWSVWAVAALTDLPSVEVAFCYTFIEQQALLTTLHIPH
jgi:hypothetical protein